MKNIEIYRAKEQDSPTLPTVIFSPYLPTQTQALILN
jgi:hypothetical protein